MNYALYIISGIVFAITLIPPHSVGTSGGKAERELLIVSALFAIAGSLA